MTTDLSRELDAINANLQSHQRSQWQPVNAHYYSFIGDSGRLDASLIVLLDSHRRAVQAELHFYGPPAQGQTVILRQAQSIVGTRYAGSGPSTPLYVMESDEQQATIHVGHSGTPTFQEEQSFRLWPILAAIGALLVLIALVGAIVVMLRPADEEVTGTPVTTSAALVAQQAQAIEPEPTAVAQSEGAPPRDPQTNGLPPSRNADPRLALDIAVQIKPQLRSFVRSLPGSDQGEALGYLEDGDTAIIVGGPIWLQGDTDTIVWWYVELENGVKGWTPANTSQLTLLEPVAAQ